MHAAKTIPPAVVASAVRSSGGANKHEFGAHTDPDAPLHLALAGQAFPSAVGVGGACSTAALEQNTLLRHTDPPPRRTRRGAVSRISRSGPFSRVKRPSICPNGVGT